MSVQTTTPESYECSREGCTVTKTAPSLVEGSYCSERCAALETGANLLEHIRRDHRICSTCYKFRKTVEEPPDEYRRRFSPVVDEAVIGFEYPTEHQHVEGGVAYCGCGTIGTRDDHEFIKNSELKSTIFNLYRTVDTLREEGQTEVQFDPKQLAIALRETGFDWELALGRAVNE